MTYKVIYLGLDTPTQQYIATFTIIASIPRTEMFCCGTNKKQGVSRNCLPVLLCVIMNYLLRAVATSTAQATVQPTIGLLPMPRNPIISTCAGPASYGMTDTMGRMHSDAQFAGSSSVPAHVEMMGFLGIGNNPMVGCTVACAVDVATALNK